MESSLESPQAVSTNDLSARNESSRDAEVAVVEDGSDESAPSCHAPTPVLLPSGEELQAYLTSTDSYFHLPDDKTVVDDLVTILDQVAGVRRPCDLVDLREASDTNRDVMSSITMKLKLVDKMKFQRAMNGATRKTKPQV